MAEGGLCLLETTLKSLHNIRLTVPQTRRTIFPSSVDRGWFFFRGYQVGYCVNRLTLIPPTWI